MNRTAFFFVFSFLVFATACTAQVKDPAYKAMLAALLSHNVPERSVAEVSRDTSPPLMLDAREPKEYEVSRLRDAVSIGYDHFSLDQVKDVPKDREIVVYCSVGYRSEKIAEKLIAAGYKNVSNLYGGIFEWVNQGNLVYNASGKTDRVHAYDRSWGLWLKKGKKVY